MIQLAFIQLNRSDQGDDIAIPVTNIREVRKHGAGSKVTLNSGEPVEVTETVTQVMTEISDLWTAWLTALGDPS